MFAAVLCSAVPRVRSLRPGRSVYTMTIPIVYYSVVVRVRRRRRRRARRSTPPAQSTYRQHAVACWTATRPGSIHTCTQLACSNVWLTIPVYTILVQHSTRRIRTQFMFGNFYSCTLSSVVRDELRISRLYGRTGKVWSDPGTTTVQCYTTYLHTMLAPY